MARTFDTKRIVPGQRDTVVIDGERYRLRQPEDLTMRMSATLQELSDRHSSIDNLAEGHEVMISLCQVIFLDIPSMEVLQDVTYGELEGAFNFFVERSQEHQRAKQARQSRPPAS